MGNHIENLSHEGVVNPDAKRWEQFVKPVPQLSGLLTEVEEMFGAPGIGTLICDASHQFDSGYLRWQTVRGPRAKEVIGVSPLTTGFEGYYAGFIPDPGAVVAAEAELGQQLLDKDVRGNQYARDRRHLIDKFMYEQKVPSLRVLRPLDRVFVDLLASSRIIAAKSKDDDAKTANAKFRETTKASVSGIPPITFASQNDQLIHAYSLPQGLKSISTPGPGESDIPREYQDGFRLLQSIGIMGHPVVLRLLSNPIIMVRASSQSYNPPKGSPRRIRLDGIARLDLINSIASVAPKAVEEYLK